MIGCPAPDKDDPIPETYPQENIAWPSLGDTPWPMHHHDPQSTGRSQYAGPQGGVVYKKVNAGVSESGITIGYNSTVFTSSSLPPNNFYCLDYEGNIKWVSSLHSQSTPLVGSDSMIYLGGVGLFVAFTPDGDTLWQRTTETFTLGVNIDMNGNLFYIDNESKLTKMSKNGDILWQLQSPYTFLQADDVPTFSPDGNTLYAQGSEVSVVAIDIVTQEIKWAFGNEKLMSGPVIDNDGNLYFIPGDVFEWSRNDSIDRILYCLTSAGEIEWEFPFVSEVVWDNTEPTIDYDGNIYFATDTLYALNHTGDLRWKVPLEGNTISPLICDINNVIYVGAKNREIGQNQIYAVTAEGEILWVIRDSEIRSLGVSPAISEDGTLFYPTWDSVSRDYLIIK